MRTKWKKRLSALLFPKSDKVPWRRSQIAAKGKFRVKDNPLKDYRQRYPNEQLRVWAEQRRAEQISKRWPAEMAFKAILDKLPIHYEHQKIIYRTGSFVLLDFYIPAKRVAFELDGSSHRLQADYDSGRDKWLLGTHGIRTVRLSNITAQRNPLACEGLIWAELRI